MEYTLPQLTKQKVLELALSAPYFRDFLLHLSKAEGYGPESLIFVDDHTNSPSSCDSVILVLTLDSNCVLSSPYDPSKTVQDGKTHLPIWIFRGIEQKHWRARSKNPLYVANDGKIHLTKMAAGITIRQNEQPDLYESIVTRKEVAVVEYYSDTDSGYISEKYEAHISLPVSELNQLIASLN